MKIKKICTYFVNDDVSIEQSLVNLACFLAERMVYYLLKS